jgi:hypothetical protein
MKFFLSAIVFALIIPMALADPLLVSPAMVSLSAVKEKASLPGKLTLRNPGTAPLPIAMVVVGKDAAAFRVAEAAQTLDSGASCTVEISFTPLRGMALHDAELKIGDSTSIELRGVGLNAFEGKNEPPLNLLVKALGIPTDVGGSRLELDVKAEKIGDGISSGHFRGLPGTKAKITPLARFSPPGVTPFGWVASTGELHELGQLADSSNRPDTHQALFPSLTNGRESIEFTPPEERFAIYMKGHLYTAFTDPSLPTSAKIPHTVRVYPVASFQGKPMKHTYLIACEEASNGDYQDAVFLLENVTHE